MTGAIAVAKERGVSVASRRRRVGVASVWRRVSAASRRRRVGIELRLLHIMTVKMTERKLLK